MKRVVAVVKLLSALWLVWLVSLAGVATRSAHAQSCCGAVSADELSVVGFDRRAVVTLRLGIEPMLGSHDSQGGYHGLAEEVSAVDGLLVLGGGVRMPFYEPLQVHGSLPLRVQHRELPSDSATQVGVGDASLMLRWSLSRDDELGLFASDASAAPSLDLFAGTELPSGRHDDGADADALARTMGTGVVSVIVGARAIKYLTSEHALSLGARYDHRFSREDGAGLAAAEYFPGDVLSLGIGWLGTSGMYWGFGAGADVAFTLAASAQLAGQEREELAGSAMHETRVQAHVTRSLVMPELDLTLSAAYTLPFDRFSENVSLEGLLLALTLRYHVMT